VAAEVEASLFVAAAQCGLRRRSPVRSLLAKTRWQAFGRERREWLVELARR